MFHRLMLLLIVALACLSPRPISSQEKSPGAPRPAELTPQSDAELTSDQIAEQRKAAESAELPEKAKTQILSSYDQAATELTRAETFRKSRGSDEQRIESAEATSKDLQQQIESVTPEVPDDFGSGKSLDELQTDVLTKEKKIEDLKRELADLQTEASKTEARREELAAAQTSIKTRREEAQKQLDQAPPEGEDPMLSNARRTLARARLAALDAEEPAIDAELRRFQAESTFEVPRRRMELNRKQTARLEAEVAQLKKRQDEARQDEAEEKKDDIDDIPTGTTARTQAEDWLKKNQSIVEKIPAITQSQQTRETQLTSDSEAEKKLRDRVDQFDVIQPVGMELQEQLVKLRDMQALRNSIDERDTELARLTFQRQSHRELLEDLEREKETASDERAASLEAQISILSTLARNETTYIEALRSLDRKERQLLAQTEEFSQWLSERVLWIRSNRGLWFNDISASAETLGWLCSPSLWMQIPETLFADILGKPLLYLASFALILALLVMRSRLHKRLTRFGQRAKAVRCATYRPTIRALFATLMLALPLPLTALFLGLRLYDAGTSDFVRSAGLGLEATGVVFLVMNFLKQSCRNDGLGEAHFSWTDSAIRSMRLGLRNLILVLLPLLFVGTMLHNARTAPGQDSLERLCFIAGLLVVAFFCYRLLNPKRGIFAAALNDDDVGWGQRTVWLWYPALIGIPLALAALVITGYFFTAYELTWRLAGTLCLTAGCVVLQALLVRWNLIQQRRLHLQQSKLKMQAVRDCDAEAEAQVEEESQTITTVSEQTHRLINSGLVLVGLAGLWLLWSQVLPAVSFLTQKELWRTAREVSVEEVVDGTPRVSTETVLEPITPLSILKAVFLVIATITAARNLPGLLEIMVLQRLPLEPALRYALRTVTRYLLVIVGITAAFSVIGIGWAKVQWLVAGLTVGLGFGLQEIFANFVSGLIILFERPVRLGDVVTIDDVSGTVSRIQIRATTITDWDRKEYIVPNKELVTGRVLNWTLSDSTSRIVIEVGVAYGTDTNAARKLLIETAAAHPLVLEDPGPIATFEKFGDSTLNLILRCYMPSLDGRLDTISELHTAINESFAEAGIEIAFPQLDVNLNQSA